MKTPISMLEDIAAEITENASLLEVIFRINEFLPEADNAIACLIRSMHKTLDNANAYIEQASNQPPPIMAAVNDISDAVLATKKLEALIQITHESFVSTKNEDDHLSLMLSSVWDYANEVCDALRSIEKKVS